MAPARARLMPLTVFILIEARRASAGISPSETVLISGENNYCDRNTTYPIYITSFSLLYALLKQVCTKRNNCKVKQFQWFCQGHIQYINRKMPHYTRKWQPSNARDVFRRCLYRLLWARSVITIIMRAEGELSKSRKQHIYTPRKLQ